MSITRISDWLAVRGPYVIGVELLQSVRELSATQRTLFKLPDSPFTRSRLEAALREVLDTAITETVATTNAQIPTAVDPVEERVEGRLMEPSDRGDVPESELPASLIPVRKEVRDAHRNLVYLRGTLRLTTDGMELRRTCEDIVDLRKKVRSGWLRIEGWRMNGTDPRSAPAEPQGPSVEELRAELKRLRVYLDPKRIEQRRTPADRVERSRARKVEVEQLLHAAEAH